MFEINARRDARLKLVDKLEKLVTFQSALFSESLWNVADEQIKLILAALAIDPDVLGAAVYDDSDKLAGAIGSVEEIVKQQFRRETEIVYVYNEKRRVIGRLSIALTETSLRSAARERMLLAVGLATILLISVVVSALVGNRRTIGIPVERLLESINRSRDDGARQQVDWRSNDEIGEVVSAFNEMQERQEAYERGETHARLSAIERRLAQIEKKLDNGNGHSKKTAALAGTGVLGVGGLVVLEIVRWLTSSPLGRYTEYPL